MKTITLSCFLSLLTLLSSAAQFDLGAPGILSVEVPPAWTTNRKPATRNDGTVIGHEFTFKPREGSNAKCLITFANIRKPSSDKAQNNQEKFVGIKSFWENETKGWSRQNLPAPKEVSFQNVSRWEVICYDVPLPVANGSSSHLRAHWMQAGTWIDLHLSISSRLSSADAREKVLGILKGIQVHEKL